MTIEEGGTTIMKRGHKDDNKPLSCSQHEQGGGGSVLGNNDNNPLPHCKHESGDSSVLGNNNNEGPLLLQG